jgi:hypothetical protein
VLLTIIAILLFAIALGNEGSRKVLAALVGWVLIVAGILMVLGIALGLIGGVFALAISGQPLGMGAAVLYIFCGLMTTNFYGSFEDKIDISVLGIILSWVFWPIALPLLVYAWFRVRAER